MISPPKPSDRLASPSTRAHWAYRAQPSRVPRCSLDAKRKLVLPRVMAANNRPGIDGALKGLASAPNAMALCQELRKLTELASGPGIAEIVGTSRAAPALNKDPASRGPGTLPVEAANTAPQHAGTGKQAGTHPSTGSLGMDEDVRGLGAQPTSKPTTVRQAFSRMSRAPHASKGRNLLDGPNARAGSLDKQRSLLRFTGEWGKGAMAWTMCQGIEP